MSHENDAEVRLGTRGSALARWQADWVASQLQQRNVSVGIELIQTTGDVQQQPIGQGSAPGLFTKEIQRAVLEGRVDLAVHSLKDLPTDDVDGLCLASVPPRESHRDVLISRDNLLVDQLPPGARIGTGSRRRQSQLLHLRPDLVVESIRGNLDTRLRKLDEGQYDAILLAEAGLRRLGWTDRITQVLTEEQMLPAVGQGALGLECRADDERVKALLAMLDDAATHAAVLAERSLLSALRGGCLAPIAAWGRILDDELHLTAAVLSLDGRDRIVAASQAAPADAVSLGQEVAGSLLRQGAADLIAAARE